MPIRRNLSASLPPQSPESVAKVQVFEEGMFPLQCTPEPARKTDEVLPLSSSTDMDPNVTFQVLDDDDQTANNETIILSGGGTGQPSKSFDFSGHSRLQHPPKANEGKQIPTKRSENIHVCTFLYDFRGLVSYLKTTLLDVPELYHLKSHNWRCSTTILLPLPFLCPDFA